MFSPYVRELSIREILTDTFELYQKSFLTIALSYLLPCLPGLALYGYGLGMKSMGATVAGLFLLLIGGFFGYSGIALCISDLCVGNPPSIKRSVFSSAPFAGKLFLVSVLQILLIFAGLICFIIPGLLFALWFLLAPLTVVLEGRSGWAAFKRSMRLGKGFHWRNFGVFSLAWLTSLAIYLVGFLGIFLTALGLSYLGAGKEVSSVVGAILGSALSVVAYPVFFIALVLTYYDLRARKEGFDSVALAAELSR